VQRGHDRGSLEGGLALSAIGSTWRESARDGQVGPTSLCARETDGKVRPVGAPDPWLGRAAGTGLMGRLCRFGFSPFFLFPFFCNLFLFIFKSQI
jgi:hypothetical protein